MKYYHICFSSSDLQNRTNFFVAMLDSEVKGKKKKTQTTHKEEEMSQQKCRVCNSYVSPLNCIIPLQLI